MVKFESASFKTIHYPIHDSQLPFHDYIAQCRRIIEEHRIDISQDNPLSKIIIEANSPFELVPTIAHKVDNYYPYGALLLHGLFDSPFSLKDIGLKLQNAGIFSRSILLPGHGTKPQDLLNVSYHSWIQAMRYGFETMRKEVKQIYLIGYSTGAALSVYQALQDADIAGIILLSPAIRIKVPVNIFVAWQRLRRLISPNRKWLFREDEIDYAKYSSIPFKAIDQINRLTQAVRELYQAQRLDAPVFLVISREDETVSSDQALGFFKSLKNLESKMLLYSSWVHAYPDHRITARASDQFGKQISHFSHSSIPFSPNNFHYGREGDYAFASHAHQHKNIYGAYTRIEISASDLLYKLNIIRHPRRELTYNPDFDYMAEEIIKFILRK